MLGMRYDRASFGIDWCERQGEVTIDARKGLDDKGDGIGGREEKIDQ